jgi:hypothetical protein
MTDQQNTVTLTDGVNTVGIMTNNRTNVRRMPRGTGVERKAARQMTWGGGRGLDRFATDTTRFSDSKNLWTMVSGWAMSGPLFDVAQFGNVVRALKPVSNFAWARSTSFPNHSSTIALASDTIVARSFVPGTSFTARNLAIWLRITSDSGFYMAIYSDSAGSPGTVLWSVNYSLTVTDSLKVGGWLSIDPNLALTAGTTYWIGVYFSGTGNRWIGVDTGTAGKQKTGSAAWAASTFTPLFYLCDAAIDYKFMHFFQYQRTQYMVTQRADNGAAKLYLNGDRGVATNATGSQTVSTLRDTTKAWTVNEWAGCVCLIIAGTNEFEYRTIASNTADTLTLSTDWPTAPTVGAAGSVYVIVGSDKWTEISTTGLTVGVQDVAVANEIVYFSQGTAVNVRRMREYNNAGVWTREFADDGTNKAILLTNAVHWSSGAQAIYRTTSANLVSVAPAVTWGTALTFETALECGNLESPIRSMVEYGGDIWAAKDDGIWTLKSGKFGRVPFGMEAAADERNGAAATGWNQQYYFSLLDGLERLYGNVVDDIGPNRDESMSFDRRGAIVQLVPVAQYLLADYDAGSGGKSAVMATTQPGGDWHEIFRAPEIGKRLRGMAYQTIPGKANRLWLAYGHLIGCLTMPDDVHNPMNDVNMRYTPEAQLITAWFDLDSPEMDHLFRQLRITAVNADAGYGVRLEYEAWPTGINVIGWRDPTWLDLGSDIEIGQSVQRRTIGDGKVTGNKIRFRLSMTSDTVIPMGLKTIELRGDTMNEVLYDFIMDVRADDRMMLMDGSEGGTALAALAILESWKESGVLLTLDVAGDTTGLFTAIPGHIDPVSLVTQEWNDASMKLVGNIVFKQTA